MSDEAFRAAVEELRRAHEELAMRLNQPAVKACEAAAKKARELHRAIAIRAVDRVRHAHR